MSTTLSVAVAQQFDDQAEQQLVQMLNLERARAGLPSLKVDDHLTQAARAHSVLMAKAKQLSHQFPDEPPLPKRLASTNLRFNRDAENVAYDYSVQQAHEGLMQSPPHRANILSPNYNTVGIGVFRSGDVLWVTQDFAHRLREYSVDEAENAILAGWQRERKRANSPAAQVVRIPQLRRMACAMAQQGRLDTRAPLNLPDVQAAVVYNESDPAKLAPNAVKMAHDTNITRVAVGACFADSEQYPAGTWWVAMVFL
ncbi:MAG: CAP domain-containing protein [Terriglobales bacterium]